LVWKAGCDRGQVHLVRRHPHTRDLNRGILFVDWKLVAEWDGPWELYNITEDRTEANNLIEGEADRAKELEKLYFEWAARAGVLEWPVDPKVLAKRLLGDHAHISQHRASPSGAMK